MDGLGNTQVGGPNGFPDRLVAQRFRATSSVLTGVRITLPNVAMGYWGGTGGTLRVMVQTDDGTAAHDPSGTILAQVDVIPANLIAVTNWPLITFPSPPTLTSGALYHIVFLNVDPNPAANFTSIDSCYVTNPFTPREPKYPNSDWALLYKDSSWVERAQYTPITDYRYADGSVDGLAYVFSDIGSPRTISGAANVRETFTVSGGNRTISTANVRATQDSGALSFAITQAGTTLRSGSATGTGWLSTSFSSLTLTNGVTYSLELSSAGSYSIYAPYDGSIYGPWEPQAYFGDGKAQYNSGGTWFDWGGRTDHDFQFYLQ